jgi:hypothetical protein
MYSFIYFISRIEYNKIKCLLLIFLIMYLLIIKQISIIVTLKFKSIKIRDIEHYLTRSRNEEENISKLIWT